MLEGLGRSWGEGLGIPGVPRRRPARSWRVWAELAAGREEVSLLVPFWSRFWTTAGCVLPILCRVSKMPRDGGGGVGGLVLSCCLFVYGLRVCCLPSSVFSL